MYLYFFYAYRRRQTAFLLIMTILGRIPWQHTKEIIYYARAELFWRAPAFLSGSSFLNYSIEPLFFNEFKV